MDILGHEDEVVRLDWLNAHFDEINQIEERRTWTRVEAGSGEVALPTHMVNMMSSWTKMEFFSGEKPDWLSTANIKSLMRKFTRLLLVLEYCSNAI